MDPTLPYLLLKTPKRCKRRLTLHCKCFLGYIVFAEKVLAPIPTFQITYYHSKTGCPVLVALGRLRLMAKYIRHRLVARPEPNNTPWNDTVPGGLSLFGLVPDGVPQTSIFTLNTAANVRILKVESINHRRNCGNE